MRLARWLAGWCALWGAAGCVAAVEALDLESPEEAEPPEAFDQVPDEPPPSLAEESADDRFVACAQLIGDAEGMVREDLQTLCGATRYDGDCVGFACARTEPREAMECLIVAGEIDRVVALEHAAGPVTRAYAREALSRSDGWTEDRLRAAMSDEAEVESCGGGCTCESGPLSSSAVMLALRSDDRAAMQPLLAEWVAARPSPATLLDALREDPTGAWIERTQLRALVEDEAHDLVLRTVVAHALALRGDDAGRAVLYASTEHHWSWVRDVGVRGLDLLDDGEAWDRLVPLLDDGSGTTVASIMRLGARLRPDEAVLVLDARPSEGDRALAELPPRLFAPRAARAVCGYRWTELEQQARLLEALGRLPRKARCRALRRAEGLCPFNGPVAHDLAPQMAEACGIAPPPVQDPEPVERVAPRRPSPSPCHRLRSGSDADALLDLEARAIEAQRRARASGVD